MRSPRWSFAPSSAIPSRTDLVARGIGLAFAASMSMASPSAAQSPAPELVVNGDFASGFAHWNPAGFAGHPVIELFDTTGLGASACFAADPNVAFVGFSAFTIYQDVPVIAGQRYAFSMDTSYAAPASTVGQAGLLTVQIDSDILIQKDFGQLAVGQLARDALSATFVASRTGAVKLRFTLHKLIFPFVPVARMRVDNLSVRRMDGPMVCVRGDRRPGDVVAFEVHGDPGDASLTLVATQRATVAVALPGFAGAAELLRPTVFDMGSIPVGGVRAFAVTIPPIPVLAGHPVEFQAVGISAGPGLMGGFGPGRNFGIQR